MKRTNYSPYHDFVLRVPGLSIEKLKQIPDNDSGLQDFVRQCWKDDLIRNAIILASPNFYQTLSNAVKNDSVIPSKVCASFVNYYTRFCTRPTPFGLFAGVVSGQVTKKESVEIELLPSSEGTLQCRLDMEYLCYMVDQLSTRKGVREKLKYDYNSSFFVVSSYFLFVAGFHDKNGKKKYTLEAIDGDDPLFAVLDSLDVDGSYAGMLKGIQETVEDESDKECEKYLLDVLNLGLVVHDLVPNLVGEEYSKVLRYKVIDRNMANIFAPFLKQYALVESIQLAKDVEVNLGHVAEIAKNAQLKFNKGHLIQGDFLRKTSANNLPELVTNKVLYGLRIVRALTNLESEDPLKEFKRIFKRRYTNNYVDLHALMDQNCGIGLNGPAYQQQVDPCDLLDDLAEFGTISNRDQFEKSGMVKWSNEAFPPDNMYIELTKTDLKKFDLNDGEWPEQLHAVVSLAGSTDDPEIIFRGAGEGHAGHILGRFGFLPDKGINGLFEKTARDEENLDPDKIYAEIVHLPEERTGNVLQRPVSYSYDIPYLTTSLKPESQQISTSHISVSIVDDTVVLKHEPSGKQVIPCLNNAHNYESKQLPLYEFLVKCGKQKRQRAFRLDRIEKHHGEFVPGVRFENIVFRLPVWRLSLQSIRARIKQNPGKEIEEIQKWAMTYGMPNQVVMKHGDQNLFIDWNNPVLINSFWRQTKGLSVVSFEVFPYTSGSPVKEKKESFTNEIVLCFHSMMKN